MNPTGMALRFSEQLKLSCSSEWQRAHETHPFLTAMGDGSLSLERFSYFMRQDYLFLIDYCRVVSLACAKCPDLDSMGWWAKLLDETLNSEMELHRGFCADFGVPIDDLEATEPAPATSAYTSHLLRLAYEETIGVISAALLPCQWGYDEVGQMLGASMAAPADSFHARWIAGYNAPEYRELTAWLRRFVDRLGQSASGEEKERMRQAFHASTRYEYLFWDAAWRLELWP